MKDMKLAFHAVLLLAALSGGCSNDTATSPASTATTSTAGVVIAFPQVDVHFDQPVAAGLAALGKRAA